MPEAPGALPPALISTQALADALGGADLRILDCRVYVPGMGRDARREFAEAHLPGAVHYDLDSLSDPDSPYPHMLVSPARLALQFGQLGVAPGDLVVLYDTIPGLGAMRVWWHLQLLGHARAQVLDGGWERWRAEGRPVTDAAAGLHPVAYPPPATPPLARFVGADAVARAIAKGSAQILDVRPANRFDGSVAEPRPGVRSGHMPGAVNLPFPQLFAADGSAAPPQTLRARLEAAGLDLARPVITSCGSGVTAAAAAFVLTQQLGLREVAIYDGSWTEWGSRHDLPAVSGPTSTGAGGAAASP